MRLRENDEGNLDVGMSGVRDVRGRSYTIL